MITTPQTIRQQVTNRIREDLVSGRFPVGSTIRETELAAILGVSRGPVRDAFIQLSHEGFLAYQANRGVTVRDPPKPEDREFVTGVRLQIESYVIQKGIADVTAQSLERINHALEKLELASETKDAARVAQYDIAFHESILIACGGDDLVGVWRLLCARMMLTYTRLNNYDQMYREHVDIYQALKSKDKRATIAALTANIK